MHPEIFPLDINRADKFQLLRVPGLGLITVNRILKYRQLGRIHRIEDISKPGKLINKAKQYLKF
jgi:predicted DNA-binding helix-hairpin-helix protein